MNFEIHRVGGAAKLSLDSNFKNIFLGTDYVYLPMTLKGVFLVIQYKIASKKHHRLLIFNKI